MPHVPDGAPTMDNFQTTHWSLVIAAGERDSPQSREALAQLCSDYWQPLYAYLRRTGRQVHDAQDLTQAFLAKLLEKNYVEAANQQRGRFRSFLLAALKHYAANEQKAGRAKKRGGGKSPISFDHRSAEAAYLEEPSDNETPDRVFDRAWALQLLERVLNRLEADYVHAGKQELFTALKRYLVAGQEEQSHSEVARTLNCSPAAAKMAAHRLRKRYRELLRQEIGQTVAEPGEIDDELRHLFQVLAKKND